MKNLYNDTTAGIATAISGSSALITFTTTYYPVVSFALAVVGIISGLFAIRYYSKKIEEVENGKGKN